MENKLCSKCNHEIPQGSDHSCEDIGDTVVCDLCNENYTNSEAEGGCLVGSYAYCPKCVNRVEQRFIDAFCPRGLTFKQWVLLLRGGNNTIRFDTGDNAMPWKK